VTPRDRLREAIKQLRIARDDANLHPQWDGKLAEAEVNLRGVADYLDDPEAEEIGGGLF